jgi:hypothetical protein
MFTLKTTIAVLIAFLALVAYSRVQNRRAKNIILRSRDNLRALLLIPIKHKDVEAISPKLQPVEDNGGDHKDGGRKLGPLEEDIALQAEMKTHKQLYHKLHNLEHYPEILPECRHILSTLLSETLSDALKEPNSGILSVSTFSRDALNDFLKRKDTDITDQYEQYVARRKSGSPREMFSDKEEAKWWLKQAAPVKYVDGAWLGQINKISTPFAYRRITKNAWQVMSEELGDGDLAKNHVHVYRDLMQDIDAGLPEADAEDFIHPRHGLNEARCWKAAMAQLLVSLFPHDFLPEALGFNMSYESLPLHLLKTIKEMRELKLNPYYFELHVSIDNADSGHAAMAMETVADYITLIAETEGEEAAHVAWKRVQAGYILADGLLTTPDSPSLRKQPEVPFPRNDTEVALLEIFKAKSPVAHKIHCNSRLKIGRRSLVDWLEPNAFKDPKWQQDFLLDLGNCRPWVIKGNSEKSRLIREISWEGKMFGSFTQTEVETLKAWIDSLGASTVAPATSDPRVYHDFVKKPYTPKVVAGNDPLVDYPVVTDASLDRYRTLVSDPFTKGDSSQLSLDLTNLNPSRFIPLWFASLAVLESFPSVPVRAADTLGSALIRVLRAQTGFSDEGPGVAGMDEVRRTEDGQAIGLVELGLEMCTHLGLGSPKSLADAVAIGDAEAREFAVWIVGMSMQWLQYKDVLIGMAWAAAEMHAHIAETDVEHRLLGLKSNMILKTIADREMRGLRFARAEIEKDQKRMDGWKEGFSIMASKIMKCNSI